MRSTQPKQNCNSVHTSLPPRTKHKKRFLVCAAASRASVLPFISNRVAETSQRWENLKCCLLWCTSGGAASLKTQKPDNVCSFSACFVCVHAHIHGTRRKMVGVSESEKATRARLAFSRAHNGNWNAGEMRRAARNDELRSENRWWNYKFHGEPDDVKLHWVAFYLSLDESDSFTLVFLHPRCVILPVGILIWERCKKRALLLVFEHSSY